MEFISNNYRGTTSQIKSFLLSFLIEVKNKIANKSKNIWLWSLLATTIEGQHPK